jgi:hypothetical protein
MNDKGEITINNLSEFVSVISELNKESIYLRTLSASSISFYRGQSDFSWGLSPRLYREKLLDKESVLIAEFLRIASLSFQQMAYFDILVKMQHYGLPTRLLDTTLNPLVALFFACHGDGQKDKDGSVYVFPNLPVFKQGLNNISLIMKFIFEYSGFRLDLEEFTRDVISSKEIYSSYARKYKSKDDVLGALTLPFHAVLPTLNNPRILNQDGSFFLFGMTVMNKKTSNNPETVNKTYYEFETVEFDNNVEKFWSKSKILRVPADKKALLLEELEYIGITRNKMFPELEYQAECITNLIKKEKKNKTLA